MPELNLDDPLLEDRLYKIERRIKDFPQGDLCYDGSPKEEAELDREFLILLVRAHQDRNSTLDRKISVAHKMDSRRGKSECWSKDGSNLRDAACGSCKRTQVREKGL